MWEYLVARESDDLNALGLDGWELVAIAGVGSYGNPSRLFFKRPL